MAFKHTKKQLSNVLVPKERVIGRGRGCWNCIHWGEREEASKLWTAKRQNDLKRAVEIDLEHPTGAAPDGTDQRVYNIRKMVDSLDHLVASGHVRRCHGGGRTQDGKEVGDFVTHAFLCDRWTGRQGAREAHEGKVDLLPEELHDRMDKKN